MSETGRLFLRIFLSAAVGVALAACGTTDGDGTDDVVSDAFTDVDTGPSAPESCVYPGVFPPAECSSCHDAPPTTATHPPNPWCWRCHGYVVDANYDFVQPALHNNGTVDVALGCTSCHGWNLDTAPPQGLDGSCDYGSERTGAHAAMRRGGPAAHRTGCNNCHLVPDDTWSTGHIDGDGKAEVVFGVLATADGAQPTWDGETCSNVYCHGATLSGGDLKTPNWRDKSRRAGRCGACHRLTDPDGNEDADCSSCHPTSVDADRNILEFGTHINGHIDMGGDEL